MAAGLIVWINSPCGVAENPKPRCKIALERHKYMHSQRTVHMHVRINFLGYNLLRIANLYAVVIHR